MDENCAGSVIPYVRSIIFMNFVLRIPLENAICDLYYAFTKQKWNNLDEAAQKLFFKDAFKKLNRSNQCNEEQKRKINSGCIKELDIPLLCDLIKYICLEQQEKLKKLRALMEPLKKAVENTKSKNIMQQWEGIKLVLNTFGIKKRHYNSFAESGWDKYNEEQRESCFEIDTTDPIVTNEVPLQHVSIGVLLWIDLIRHICKQEQDEVEQFEKSAVTLKAARNNLSHLTAQNVETNPNQNFWKDIEPALTTFGIEEHRVNEFRESNFMYGMWLLEPKDVVDNVVNMLTWQANSVEKEGDDARADKLRRGASLLNKHFRDQLDNELHNQRERALNRKPVDINSNDFPGEVANYVKTNFELAGRWAHGIVKYTPNDTFNEALELAECVEIGLKVGANIFERVVAELPESDVAVGVADMINKTATKFSEVRAKVSGKNEEEIADLIWAPISKINDKFQSYMQTLDKDLVQK